MEYTARPGGANWSHWRCIGSIIEGLASGTSESLRLVLQLTPPRADAKERALSLSEAQNSPDDLDDDQGRGILVNHDELSGLAVIHVSPHG